jgi:glycosyltransferase involved in cell wall biosynthesis
VLKGFPRLSEIFIASEIYRLEQLGASLKLFVIKPADESFSHEVVDHIKERPTYLPRTTSLSAVPFVVWLFHNLPRFLPSLLRVAVSRPSGTLRAAASAIAQAIRSRKTFWSIPRKQCLKEFLQAAALATQVIASPEIHHLHAHFSHGATTVAWWAAIITGLPFSFTAHAKDIYCESLNPAGLLKRKLDAAEFVVTCTEANRKHLQALSSTKVHRIYHGLNADFERLLSHSKANSSQPRALRILAVGRLVPKKGFDVLIDACALLRDAGLSFEAIIIGESGEHEADIRSRITRYGLAPQIQLKPPVRQSELFEEYRRATVFCLPCRVLDNGDRDGIPNVLMEAMACGLPIITTNVSGIPELISNQLNGMMIPPEDAEALANAMIQLNGNPEFANRLAKQSQATVKAKFDGSRFAQHLASLFEEALA